MSLPNNKKYSLSEIHVGMKIQDREQLDNIHDMWIILVKKPEDTEYTIGFIGEKTNSKSDDLLKNYITCPIYNDSIDVTEDIYYEE